MTYDEFMDKYLDHIEGRVDANERNANRPITAEGAESKGEVEGSKVGKPAAESNVMSQQ
jgi:hypothetical protein